MKLLQTWFPDCGYYPDWSAWGEKHFLAVIRHIMLESGNMRTNKKKALYNKYKKKHTKNMVNP